jgi:hypothetical protein
MTNEEKELVRELVEVEKEQAFYRLYTAYVTTFTDNVKKIKTLEKQLGLSEVEDDK